MNVITSSVIISRVVLALVALTVSSVTAGCSNNSGQNITTSEATATCGDGTRVFAKTRAGQKSECANHGSVKRYLAPPEVPVS